MIVGQGLPDDLLKIAEAPRGAQAFPFLEARPVSEDRLSPQEVDRSPPALVGELDGWIQSVCHAAWNFGLFESPAHLMQTNQFSAMASRDRSAQHVAAVAPRAD